MEKARCGSALVLDAVLLTAGCASTGEAVSDKEDLLVNAGFVPKKADSASRMASHEGIAPAPIRDEEPKRTNTLPLCRSDGVRVHLCRRSERV